MRRCFPPLSWLMIALAIAGLTLMHGLAAHGADSSAHAATDVSASHSAAAEHTVSDPGEAVSDPVDAVPSPLTETSSHGTLASIMALCIAVLVATTALLRTSSWRLPALSQPVVNTARWRSRLSDNFRPPGPGRLELCIQLC